MKKFEGMWGVIPLTWRQAAVRQTPREEAMQNGYQAKFTYNNHRLINFFFLSVVWEKKRCRYVLSYYFTGPIYTIYHLNK
jgi:hypothetical protein